MNIENIAKMIDHTVLKADATLLDIKKLCDEAKKYKFHSVCINSSFAKYAASELEGSGVCVCCVVGFPLGAMISEAKAFEARLAIENGATEIDMVINIGLLKSGEADKVERDIRLVKEACGDLVLKVILEACLLADDEKRLVCRLAQNAKADFVKTSTGFSTSGATEADVRLMREVVGVAIGVKAAGGVRTLEDAKKMLTAGANRFGTSNGVAIITGVNSSSSY